MKRIILRIVLCLLAIACLHYHSFAQANTAPASASSDSEVLRDILNEIRQLRADILRLNVNAHRTQALLDRIKVQQEQVVRLTRELSNVSEELSAIRFRQEMMKVALEAQEKRYTAGVQGDNEVKALTADLGSLKQREQVLMEPEPLLSGELNSTRETLASLNARLDDLEREIATPATDQKQPQKRN